MDPSPFSARNILMIVNDKDLLNLGHHILEPLENVVFKFGQYAATQVSDLSNEVFQLQLENVQLSDLESSTDSFSTAPTPGEHNTDVQHEEVLEQFGEDIWVLPDLRKVTTANKLLCWDSSNSTSQSSSSTKIMLASELPSATFGALIHADQALPPSVPETLRYARPSIFLRALLDMTNGYSSALFQWDQKAMSFRSVVEHVAVSGCSLVLSQELVAFTANIGCMVRRLKESASLEVVAQGCASRYALQCALSECLYCLEEHMQTFVLRSSTLLQLRQALQQPDALLRIMVDLLECGNASGSPSTMLQKLLGLCSELVRQSPDANSVIREIVKRSLHPASKRLWVAVGLLYDNTAVSSSSDSVNLGHGEVANVSAAAKQAVQLMREDKSCQDILELLALSECPVPDILDTWKEATELQQSAQSFEQRYKDRIISPVPPTLQHHVTREASSTVVNPNPGIPNRADVAFHAINFSGYTEHSVRTWSVDQPKTNQLQNAVKAYLTYNPETNHKLRPSIHEAVELSILPALKAQHRLLSFALLRTAFQEHNVKDHVALQYRFQLLGDGIFAAQLKRTLFDADEASGDTGRSSSATIGLRLHARQNWPPASSELRLALVSVMSHSLRSRTGSDLSDNISFAIRELDDAELELCLDKDSVHALDFLCIRYSAPNSLVAACITPECLDMYDRIFKFLLLVARVQSTTQAMLVRQFRSGRKGHNKLEAAREIFQMHQFVEALADFCHNAVIRTHWQSFETLLHEADNKIANNDYEGTLETVRSLEHLRERHEQMLEGILQGLFLKRKQTAINTVIQNIFAVILRFAAATRTEEAGDEPKILSGEFGGLVRDLLEALKEQEQKMNLQLHSKRDVADQLLLRLDYSGYWTSKTGS